MNISEVVAKRLLREKGIKIPKGKMIKDWKSFLGMRDKFGNHVYLKAQLPIGKRMKRGVVRLVEQENVICELKKMFGKKIDQYTVENILIEEKIEIKNEWYLSLVMNPVTKKPQILFSEKGGIDIEETVKQKSEIIYKFDINDDLNIVNAYDVFGKLKFEKKVFARIVELILDIVLLAREKDIYFLEINPLVLDVNKNLVAVDAKMKIDDSALFRQQGFISEEKEENLAKEIGVSYVELGGNIGVIGNGAGLIMATIDEIKNMGGEAANFMDIGGNVDAEKVKMALEFLLQNRKVKKLFINIFGGIVRCDEFAKGLLSFLHNNKVTIPIVVRFNGNQKQRGIEILKNSDIWVYEDLEKAIKKIIKA